MAVSTMMMLLLSRSPCYFGQMTFGDAVGVDAGKGDDYDGDEMKTNCAAKES